MDWWMLLLLLVALSFAIDVSMVALEKRGLVRWRHTPRRGTAALGGVFGELANAFQPGRVHTVTEREWQKRRVDQAENGSDEPDIDLDANRVTIRIPRS